MHLRQTVVSYFGVEVCKVVVRFVMTGIYLQTKSKAVDGFRIVSFLRFNDSKIAVSIGGTIVFADGFLITLPGFFRVAIFVKQKRFFKDGKLIEFDNLSPGKKIELAGLARVFFFLLDDALQPEFFRSWIERKLNDLGHQYKINVSSLDHKPFWCGMLWIQAGLCHKLTQMTARITLT